MFWVSVDSRARLTSLKSARSSASVLAASSSAPSVRVTVVDLRPALERFVG